MNILVILIVLAVIGYFINKKSFILIKKNILVILIFLFIIIIFTVIVLNSAKENFLDNFLSNLLSTLVSGILLGYIIIQTLEAIRKPDLEVFHGVTAKLDEKIYRIGLSVRNKNPKGNIIDKPFYWHLLIDRDLDVEEIPGGMFIRHEKIGNKKYKYFKGRSDEYIYRSTVFTRFLVRRTKQEKKYSCLYLLSTQYGTYPKNILRKKGGTPFDKWASFTIKLK